MKFTQDNKFAAARHFNLSQARMALLATTAIVAVIAAGDYAHAQAVIDGGAVVNVPGTHASPWNVGGPLTVGDASTGTLNVGVGGVSGTVNNLSATVGNNAGSNGVVYVTGPGSVWTSSNMLTVGRAGDGVVAISSGGKVNSNTANLGLAAGSTGIVTVDGSGSSWAAGSSLNIGYDGSGTLTVSNGAKATASGAIIGLSAGSNGVATITGTGSAWSIVHDLTVGDRGTARMTVAAGATVSNEAGYIGYGFSDAAVTVTGTGSTWTNSADLHVGHEGSGRLTIANGGSVTNVNGFVSYNGLTTGNSSSVTVTGTGSTWTNTGDLYVAEVGNGRLRIESGGVVTAATAYIGENTGGKGAVDIDGLGSKLTIANELTVGRLDEGYLTITNGGVVSNGGDSFIGYGGSAIGQVTVDGPGSAWHNSKNLYVGYYGQGDLQILHGGAVSTTNASIVGFDGGSSGTVTVDGIGSRLTSTGTAVGYFSTGTLAISNGGSVDSGIGYGILAH